MSSFFNVFQVRSFNIVLQEFIISTLIPGKW